MTLNLQLPKYCTKEIRWITSVIFKEFLGINYNVIESEQQRYCLRLNEKLLILPDQFFSSTSKVWLQSSSLPNTPLSMWDGSKSGLNSTKLSKSLPVLYGKPEAKISKNIVELGLDIFGSAFFMLSRYEEMVLPDRDNHDRFPASASLAYKLDFLDRPIIDEYLEVLWAAMKHLWPRLQREPCRGKVRITCDVDAPFDCSSVTGKRLIYSIAGDVLKRRDKKTTYRRIRNYYARKHGDYRYDPNYTFDWYMAVCEKAGKRASFYFIPDHSAGLIDGCYRINDNNIIDLMRKINQRGHEVGVHGSYNSYQSLSQIRREFRLMLETCRNAGINTKIIGNRQHYLRWDTAQTPDHLDAAGFEYDTTGSFADMPGFRYGTSRQFTMWSWRSASPLKIKQRPLILMESSVISDRYMGLGYSEKSMEFMMTLKGRAMEYGGDFTLLWHNSHLTTELDRTFFTELIK